MTLPEQPSAFFGNLKAEQEPWLLDAFVTSINQAEYQGEQPFVLYGMPGSGKTALRLFLQQQAPANVLTVPWNPEPISSGLTGTPLMQAAMRQAIQALLDWLISKGQMAARLPQPPAWAGAALSWYLRRYLPAEAGFYIESREADLTPQELDWYRAILGKPEVATLKDDAGLNDQLRMLMRVLNLAQYQSVWWMVDGLETWPLQSETYLKAMMEALLSTLSVFDAPRYIFKLFASDAHREIFHPTVAVNRHRILEFDLRWNPELLTDLLEKRLALAFHQPGFRLADFSPSPEFPAWLQCNADENPRDWLALVSPLVETFQSKKRTLSPDDWEQTVQRSQELPSLRLLVERKEIKIGDITISLASEDGFKLLLYLYRRPGEICSLEEIYFCALQGLERIPRKQDKEWVHKTVWRPALDTTIYRLRQKIEPQSSKPVYLVTHPRKGLELRNTTL